MTLRRKLSAEERAEIEKQKQQEQTAQKLRKTVERFRHTFSLDQLQDKLPLRFPSKVLEPLPFRALSWYVYPGWDGLIHPQQLAVLSAFYIALHLIDFSVLRGELLVLTGITINGPGQTPFDPVSLFLCCLLRLEKGLGWKELAKFLASPEGACWRPLFGFHDRTPSGSTMREFFNTLDGAFDADLCPRFIDLLLTAGLLSPSETIRSQPGFPLAGDGMLHEAHTSMRCGQVTDTCYRPTFPEAPRPCPARQAGRKGCDCTEEVCVTACCLTTPRDLTARLIHYDGTNQEGKADPSRGRNVYGYRSYTQVVCDDDLHLSWVAYTSVHSANTDERTIFPTDLAHLRHRLPHLRISEMVADAAVGFTDCLDPVYQAGIIPVIAIRHDKSDKDEDVCKWRGYDDQGHPLCAHGYPMSFNGIDYQRLRACWVCRQVCTRHSVPRLEDAECPFRDPDRPLGQIRHIERTFIHPDGSHHYRLARLYPYRSPLWKTHYASRKNAVEGRNSQLMRLGLKRVWSYGLSGATADITFADLLINLRTLGRLVQEASLLVA